MASWPRCLYTFSWLATPSFLATSCCQKAGVQIGYWRRLAGNQQKHTYSKIVLISQVIWDEAFPASATHNLRYSEGQMVRRLFVFWTDEMALSLDLFVAFPWLCQVTKYGDLLMFHTISAIKPKSEKYHTGLHHTQYTTFCVYLEMSGCHHEPMNSKASIFPKKNSGCSTSWWRSKMIQNHQGLNSQRVDFHRNFNTFKLVLWRQGVMMIQTNAFELL